MVIVNKIMFITPSFFSIEDGIISGFKEKGYKVFHFDERKNNNKLNKVLIRLVPKVVERKMNSYYSALLKIVKEEEIDLILVVKAESMPTWFIKEIKNIRPDATTMHYMFDPIENYPKILEKTKYFDHCFSFDRTDALKYGWNFRPLYYPPSLDKVHEEIKYDASFVGTIHTDRTIVLENIIKELETQSYDNLFLYYYLPLRMMYFYHKYISRNFKNLKYKQFNVKSLSRAETDIVLKQSKHIIDVHHLAQSGLTSRTIETIGAQRKLITTNPAIKEYDFYNENNILIVDRNNPEIPKSWLDKDYEEIPYDIMTSYTIEGFIDSFLKVIK